GDERSVGPSPGAAPLVAPRPRPAKDPSDRRRPRSAVRGDGRGEDECPDRAPPLRGRRYVYDAMGPGEKGTGTWQPVRGDARPGPKGRRQGQGGALVPG